MFGLKARDTTKPVVHRKTAMMERKPLKDLGVNRTSLHNVPPKDGLLLDKGHLASGFKVFDDGETAPDKKVSFKLPLISSSNTGAVKKKTKAKNLLQHFDEIVEKKANLISGGTTVPNMAQVKFDEPLSNQLAMMHVNNIVAEQAERTLEQDALQGDDGKAVPSTNEIIQTKVPKSIAVPESSGTGAIRKNSSYTTRTAEQDNIRELKTFTLNAAAEEWKAPSAIDTTMGLNSEGGTSVGTADPKNKIPTFWELGAVDGVPYVPPSGARKIVGRRQTPPDEVGQHHQSVSQSPTVVFSELDDRTGEIMRFNRHKELRRRKAVEAMRVEQERLQRNTFGMPESVGTRANSNGLYHQVPAGVKDQASEAYSARHIAIGNGNQRGKSAWNFSQILGPPVPVEKESGERSGICIYKYPTPPNVKIRYDPADLLKMNYQQKHTGKSIQKNQDKPKK